MQVYLRKSFGGTSQSSTTYKIYVAPDGTRLKSMVAAEAYAGVHTSCVACGSGEDEVGNEIVLCDTKACTAAWHLSCLPEPLLSVPDGDWHCPDCECKREQSKWESKNATMLPLMDESAVSSGDMAQGSSSLGAPTLDASATLALSEAAAYEADASCPACYYTKYTPCHCDQVETSWWPGSTRKEKSRPRKKKSRLGRFRVPNGSGTQGTF